MKSENKQFIIKRIFENLLSGCEAIIIKDDLGNIDVQEGPLVTGECLIFKSENKIIGIIDLFNDDTQIMGFDNKIKFQHVKNENTIIVIAVENTTMEIYIN